MLLQHDNAADYFKAEKLIELGEEAQRFFESDVGQYVFQKAQDEVLTNLDILKDVDPEDRVKVRSTQNDISIPERAISWLMEAISEGNQQKAQQQSEDDFIPED